MKKLAILGISNLIIKHGYGQQLKKRMGDDCLLYGFGTSPSMTAIFGILQNDIINQYEYVVLDYCIIDSHYLVNSYTNKESIIAWLLFIIKLFQSSKSTLIFIILPHLPVHISESSSYIYRSLAKIFNISIIDFEYKFKNIDSNKLAPPRRNESFLSRISEYYC